MKKLPNIEDEIINNCDGLSLEDALAKHREFSALIDGASPNTIKNAGWELSNLFVNYSQANTLFRKTTGANDSKITLWLAKAQQMAKEFYIEHQAMPDFIGLKTSEVREIAQLSIEENIISEIPEILAYKGIILIYLPALEASKVDGATFLLAGKFPVVVHAVRFDRLDNFWFTLIHELSHVALHFDQLSTPIIDVDLWSDNEDNTDIEIQANRQTRFSFIPKTEWRTTPKTIAKLDTIIEIAERNKVHPVVIAGMIRFSSKNYKLFSDLVNSAKFKERLFPE
ncbi:ImmA/IrrE family metallo-endopeptidase [Thiomicrorhabdus heinhorstiae]|uniref:ImmA/IrrE family metallo-endopeptidase n=1 Tax=Thiomicrorhabdus heinhorstiae TaxID=2748010 RepID=A0ABS0BYZ9_9GAMM|nr:ImmA/IrrE family metallo-endopeptidase [Thiomicrorhabdus heinhorstiae]MBF6059022.1 ImmA/IrrE family metallo-endopeptidase [Thiomicrorhabdus heinhorstiae]